MVRPPGAPRWFCRPGITLSRHFLFICHVFFVSCKVRDLSTKERPVAKIFFCFSIVLSFFLSWSTHKETDSDRKWETKMFLHSSISLSAAATVFFFIPSVNTKTWTRLNQIFIYTYRIWNCQRMRLREWERKRKRSDGGNSWWKKRKKKKMGWWARYR